MHPRTIYQVLEESAAEFGDAPALQQPIAGKDGQREYLTYSWNQYKTAAQEIAAGLRSIGIGKGDVVALDSETRLEFYLADLGIVAAGSIAAALYPSYPPNDLVRTIKNCGAKALFVEDPKTLTRLREAPDMPRILPDGRGGGRSVARPACASADAWRWPKTRHYMDRLKAEVTPADYAILYLTSGATGEPKMALVTHSAVVANLDMGHAGFPLGPQDATVAFLPSAHIAQRIVVELLPMRLGTPVNFRREPAQTAAGYPGGAAHHASGAPPHVGTHLLDHLHRTAEAPGRRPQSVLWRAWRWRWRPPATSTRETGAGAHPHPPEAGRPAVLSQSAGAPRRTPDLACFRRRAVEQGTGRILRSHRHAAGGRLRFDRRRRGGPQPASTSPRPAVSARRCPASNSASPNRIASC